MVNKSFEVYKLRRELKRSGNDYEFTRVVTNKFGEPSNDEELLGTLRGLYHEKNEHIQLQCRIQLRYVQKKSLRFCAYMKMLLRLF